MQLVQRGRLASQIGRQQGIVTLDQLLDQLGAQGLDGVTQVLGHGPDLHDRVLTRHVGGWPPASLLGHQVNRADKTALGADGPLQQQRSHAQAVFHHLHHTAEIGADAVELVDEGQPGHTVGVGQAPVGLGLRLHAGDAVEHHDRAVEHPQGTQDFNVEVDVPGGVDQVDLGVAPSHGGGRALDGDATGPLLRVVVHDGSPFVHFTAAMGLASGEQDAFGGRGFARVDVGDDADVAQGTNGGRKAVHTDLSVEGCGTKCAVQPTG